MPCPFPQSDPCDNIEFRDVSSAHITQPAATIINNNFRSLLCLLGPTTEPVDLGAVSPGTVINGDVSNSSFPGLDGNLTFSLGPQDPNCPTVTMNPNGTFTIQV